MELSLEEKFILKSFSFSDFISELEKAVQNKDIDIISLLDTALHKKFIELIRKGIRENIEEFIDFIIHIHDSIIKENLIVLKDGTKFLDKWLHLMEIMDTISENADTGIAFRLIKQRAHGIKLLEYVYKKEKIRAKDLAHDLHLTEQYLAKLLREFEKEDLIKREKDGKATWVSIGFMGRYFISKELQPLWLETLEKAVNLYHKNIHGKDVIIKSLLDLGLESEIQAERIYSIIWEGKSKAQESIPKSNVIDLREKFKDSLLGEIPDSPKEMFN
ncbi:hypothetical protein HZA55_08775 [Candidatus Poribacteria bacterium]|nr:hypothetical protein [Candidatus Poribacteria bacterium]